MIERIESQKKTIRDMDLLIGSYKGSIDDLKEDLTKVSYAGIKPIREEIKQFQKRIDNCIEMKVKAQMRLEKLEK